MIPIASLSTTDDRNRRILAAYNKGSSALEVSTALGISRSTVRRVIADAGLTLRPVGRARSIPEPSPYHEVQDTLAVQDVITGSLRLHEAIVRYYRRHHPQSDVARLAA